jgi:hypothetical protein
MGGAVPAPTKPSSGGIADSLTMWPCSKGHLPNPDQPGERGRASPHG